MASVVSAREIQAVAELLQISPEGLQKAITFKVTVSLWALGTLSKPPANTHIDLHCAPSCGAVFPSSLLSCAIHLCWAQRGVTSDPKGIRYSISRLFLLPGMLFPFHTYSCFKT